MAYTLPTPDDLKARYPAFTAVEDATIEYWLTDAQRFVSTSWSEGDYAPGLMAAAAHNMARAGVAGIAGSDVSGIAAAGVTQFKSGTFQAQFSDKAVDKALAGGWASTPYGEDYYDLLRRNVFGMGVTAAGRVPCGDGFNGFAGPLPPYGLC